MTAFSQALRSDRLIGAQECQPMEPTTKTAPAREPVHLRQILVPVDFSPPSQKALKYALRFARLFGAQLTLLHVSEKVAVAGPRDIPPRLDYSEEQIKGAGKNLSALIASSKAAGSPKIESTIRTGLAAHQIVEAAKDLDVDLIVIATHGHTGWKRFCLGSTTEQVVRTAPCPVFVVREREHDFS